MTARARFIEATHVKLETGKRILLAWRTQDFPADAPDSQVDVLLQPAAGGTKVSIQHSQIPAGHAAAAREIWRSLYLDPMKRYFGKTGAMEAAHRAATRAGQMPTADMVGMRHARTPITSAGNVAAPVVTGSSSGDEARDKPRRVILRKKKDGVSVPSADASAPRRPSRLVAAMAALMSGDKGKAAGGAKVAPPATKPAVVAKGPVEVSGGKKPAKPAPVAPVKAAAVKVAPAKAAPPQAQPAKPAGKAAPAKPAPKQPAPKVTAKKAAVPKKPAASPAAKKPAPAAKKPAPKPALKAPAAKKAAPVKKAAPAPKKPAKSAAKKAAPAPKKPAPKVAPKKPAPKTKAPAPKKPAPKAKPAPKKAAPVKAAPKAKPAKPAPAPKAKKPAPKAAPKKPAPKKGRR